MAELELDRDVRLALRAQAHHLPAAVLLGNAGLSEAVMREIDRALTAHELVKIRVPGDDREARDAQFALMADSLSAARVAMIGKTLVLYRPAEDEREPARPVAQPPASGTSSSRGKVPAAGGRPRARSPAQVPRSAGAGRPGGRQR